MSSIQYKYSALFLILAMVLFSVSCDDVMDANDDLDSSLQPVENVVPVENGDSVSITVNRAAASYFSVDVQDIGSNSIIVNGERESWCIDWQKPIDSNGGQYSNVKLYSTENVRGWQRLNYLLNIKDDLLEDLDITYREIQLAIWSLRGFPEFNLSEVALEDLPSRMRSNGEPTFSHDKVDEILSIVEDGYSDFEYESGVLYAVIAETPPDVQTVIVVVEKP
ncbi:MAG: hypothetical protein JJU46_08860 [Balneolaceae bacterium]|nr:hypothetical protein [Balneolaceae bacterium]MCH8549079.1 hypothetical protein [Balneolaceae bacterium]